MAARPATSAAYAIQSPALARCHWMATAMCRPSILARIADGISAARVNNAVLRLCLGLTPMSRTRLIIMDSLSG
ncbi:hypothetical protein BG452_01105 [Streptomyces sp. CBMA123]|nr:hypothetical protein [Streptomyces sp. CBMA123]